MTIGIDLEGTLIAECGEFPCERTGTLAKLLYPNGVRTGARPLLRELTRAGHALTLYSSGAHKPWKLLLWCRLARLPVRRVVTAEQEKKKRARQAHKKQKRFAQDLKALGLTHFGKTSEVTWPPCAGMNLILDDEARHIHSAWRTGVKGVLVTNCEQDWTARIREATLQSPEIEIITLQQKATL